MIYAIRLSIRPWNLERVPVGRTSDGTDTPSSIYNSLWRTKANFSPMIIWEGKYFHYGPNTQGNLAPRDFKVHCWEGISHSHQHKESSLMQRLTLKSFLSFSILFLSSFSFLLFSSSSFLLCFSASSFFFFSSFSFSFLSFSSFFLFVLSRVCFDGFSSCTLKKNNTCNKQLSIITIHEQ